VAIPVSYPGRGSQLSYSTDAVTYFAIPQLQSFDPSGSKQTMVEQKNLLSGDAFTHPLATEVDAGEIQLSGLLNPQNPMYAAIAGFHAALTLLYWRVQLVDGSRYNFQAYVSEFKPFGVKINKLNVWSAKLRVVGALNVVPI
jgi:hypothetical protein